MGKETGKCQVIAPCYPCHLVNCCYQTCVPPLALEVSSVLGTQKTAQQDSGRNRGYILDINLCFLCSTWLSSTFDRTAASDALYNCWCIRNSVILCFLLWWLYTHGSYSTNVFQFKTWWLQKGLQNWHWCFFIVKSVQLITSLLWGKSWTNRPCNVMGRWMNVVLIWLKLAEKLYSGCILLWNLQVVEVVVLCPSYISSP